MINCSEEQRKLIGQRFKEFRESLKLPQKDVAEMLNMNQSSITSIEKGKSLPTIPVIMFLMENLGLSVLWLLTGKGNKHIPPNGSEAPPSENILDFGEHTEEAEELIYYMKNIPAVKDFIFEQFILYKYKHKKKLQDYLNNSLDKGNGNTG